MIDMTLDGYNLHEDVAFWVHEKDFFSGVWFGAIGEAFYFDDFTVVIHRGSKSTADKIIGAGHDIIRMYGHPYNVDEFAIGKDGHPRFVIKAGYADFFHRGDEYSD